MNEIAQVLKQQQVVLNPGPFDRKSDALPLNHRAGENHPLSICYPSRINASGCVFETVEPAYQYKRAIFVGDRKVAMKIKATRVGRQAKRISKTIKRTRPLSEWKEQRTNIMWSIVRRKFNDVRLKESEYNWPVSNTIHMNPKFDPVYK